MLDYIIRRVLFIIPTLLGIMFLNFILVQFVPGGPVEQMIYQFENGANLAARKGLEAIQVDLGGGKTKLPLSRLIPSNQLFDLEEILEPYCL